MIQPTLTYKIDLTQKVEDILRDEIWVYNNLKADTLRTVNEAMKFSAHVSVFVSSGYAEMELNLLTVKVTAPCIVTIKPSEVLQLRYFTDDFTASFMVISDKLRDSLLINLHDTGAPSAGRLRPVAPIDENDVKSFRQFYNFIEPLSKDKENPNRIQAVLHSLLSFYFTTGFKSFTGILQSAGGQITQFRHNTIVERFLVMVQQNFKTQRQIEFYATSLGITPKHLSRLMKQCTGFSASDWIKNYMMLEAKVMLKSSTLNMGEIAKELNFPSQSFFAKFFKNVTGMTPKQFRNTPGL